VFWLIELRVLGPVGSASTGPQRGSGAELPGCCRSRLAAGKCPRTVDLPGSLPACRAASSAAHAARALLRPSQLAGDL